MLGDHIDARRRLKNAAQIFGMRHHEAMTRTLHFGAVFIEVRIEFLRQNIAMRRVLHRDGGDGVEVSAEFVGRCFASEAKACA